MLYTISDVQMEQERMEADLIDRGIKSRQAHKSVPIQLSLPEHEDVQKALHTWRIFSDGREAIPLSRCYMHTHPDPKRCCKICKHVN